MEYVEAIAWVDNRGTDMTHEIAEALIGRWRCQPWKAHDVCKQKDSECEEQATHMARRGSVEWPACAKHMKGATETLHILEWYEKHLQLAECYVQALAVLAPERAARRLEVIREQDAAYRRANQNRPKPDR